MDLASFTRFQDFSTQCYIIDLKTALKEKDAKILKLQKKVEKLEQKQTSFRQHLWNFEIDISDSD